MYTHNKSTTTIKIEMLVVCQEAGLVCCKHGSKKNLIEIEIRYSRERTGAQQSAAQRRYKERPRNTLTQQKSINLLQDDEQKKKRQRLWKSKAATAEAKK